MAARKKKKVEDPEVTLTVRVKKSLRDSFVKTCTDVDSTGSQEVRAFMRRFVSKYGQSDMF